MRCWLSAALLFFSLPALAANYTVKAGGGGNYTTIQACATAMSAGDTCTVYAGNYTESPSVPTGTAGNFKTITVNNNDIVNVSGGFTLNSYVKLIGNCAPAIAITSFAGTSGTLTFSAVNSFIAGDTIILNGFTSPNTGLNGQTITILSSGLSGSAFEGAVTGSGYSSSVGGGSVSVGSCGFSITQPSESGACISIVDGSTQVQVLNTVQSQCGLGNDVELSMGSTNGSSYVLIQNNTFSYGCGTSSAPNNCVAISLSGNHNIVQGNDFSHFGIVVEMYGQYSVSRNNTFHDIIESECGSASGNCHMDMLYAERSNTAANYVVQYQLWEDNTATNVVGVDGKGLWTAADNPSGCGTSCFNVIGRFNVFSHFGSAMSSQTSGFLNVKYYNNSWIDPNNGANCSGGGATTSYLDDTSSGGGNINNLYYYTAYPTSQSCGWYGYGLQASGDNTGFTAGANLAYCQNGTGCGIQTLTQGTSYLFASDPNVFVSNILDATDPLTNYSGGNFHLASSSAAIAGGTYLTKVASGDSGTGTSLVVVDAGFFQDGLGLNSAGIQADCISITTVSNHICITAVNYSTNTLTMASSFSRSVGDHVWFYSDSNGNVKLTGSAPNIGALGPGSTYTITISSITGNGTVTSSDSVINCTTGTTGTCSDSSASGTIILTETPASGYSFTSWGGGTCSGSSSTCAVTSAATVTATFTANPLATAPALTIF